MLFNDSTNHTPIKSNIDVRLRKATKQHPYVDRLNYHSISVVVIVLGHEQQQRRPMMSYLFAPHPCTQRRRQRTLLRGLITSLYTHPFRLNPNHTILDGASLCESKVTYYH